MNERPHPLHVKVGALLRGPRGGGYARLRQALEQKLSCLVRGFAQTRQARSIIGDKSTVVVRGDAFVNSVTDDSTT